MASRDERRAARRGHHSTPSKQARRRSAEFFHPALASMATPSGTSVGMAGLSYTPVFSAPASPPFEHGARSETSESSDPDSERAAQELLDSVRRARQKVIAHAARSGSPAEDDWVDMILAATPKRQIRFDGQSPATPRRRSDAVRHFHPALQSESERKRDAARRRSPDWRASKELEEDAAVVERELYDLHAWRELAAERDDLQAKSEDMLQDQFEEAAREAQADGLAASHSQRRQSAGRSPPRSVRGASPPAARQANRTSVTARTPLTKAQRDAQRDSRMGGIIKGFLTNALLSRVMAEWGGFVQFQIRNYDILARTATRLRRRQLKGALTAWHAGISAQRTEVALSKGASVLIGRMVVSTELLSGWNSWRAFIKLQKAEKHGVLWKILNRCVSMAWEAWKARWVEKRRLNSVMDRVVKKILLRFLSGAWAAWVHQHTEIRRLRSGAQRVIQRLRHRAISSAVVEWRDHVDDLIRNRQIVARVLLKFKRQWNSRAFASWVSFVDESVSQRHVLQKVVLRIKQMALSSAWSGWVVSVSEDRRLRAAAKRVVAAVKHGALSMVLASWADWVYGTMTNRVVAMRVVKIFKCMALRPAFAAWHSASYGGRLKIEYTEDMLDKSRVAVRKLRAEKAFELWYGHTLTKRGSRDWVKKVMLHLVQINEANVFRAWHQWSTRQKRVKYVVRLGVLKMKNKLIAQMFLSWVIRHQQRRRLRAIYIHLWCGIKRAVFGGWCEQVRCGFLRSCMVKRVHATFRKHWEERTVWWMFEMWEGWATHRRTIRQLVLRAIGRMKHLKEACVFRAWHESAHVRQTAKRAVKWLMMRTTERRCARSLVEWRSWMVSRHRNRALQSRIVRSRLAFILHAWRKYAVVLRRFGQMLRRSCGRHVHWGFTGWVEHIRSKTHLEFDLMFDFVLAWRNQTIEASIERTAVAAAKAQAALRSKMHHRVVSLFAHRWEQHHASAIFSAWAGYTAHRHSKKTVRLKASYMLSRCKRKAVMTAWRVWVLEGGRLWNVSSRRERRILRASLDGWREKLHSIHKVRGVTIRWAAKSKQRHRQWSFNQWVDCVQLILAVSAMHSKCDRMLLRKAFHYLEEGAMVRKLRKVRVAVGLRRHLRGVKMVALHGWVGYFRRERSLQHRIVLVRKGFRKELLLKIFRRWSVYIEGDHYRLAAAHAAHEVARQEHEKLDASFAQLKKSRAKKRAGLTSLHEETLAAGSAESSHKLEAAAAREKAALAESSHKLEAAATREKAAHSDLAAAAAARCSYSPESSAFSHHSVRRSLKAELCLEDAKQAHTDEVAATHKKYKEGEDLIIEAVHQQVEAAHLAASRLLQRNSQRQIDWLRFKWVWKHWQQIWHIARVERNRLSIEHMHATTVSVQRTRAERDRQAFEQKIREVKKEAHRAEKWAHELQRAGCPMCDVSTTVVGQSRGAYASFTGRQQMPEAGGRQVLIEPQQAWAGHSHDLGLKHHLHPARGSQLVDTVGALPKGPARVGPPDVPAHHLILLK